jgi:hypothetical protein
MTKTTTLIATAAALAVVLMTGSAFAKTFEAAYTVFIHSKASKVSHVVDKLYEGERVKVQECDDDWCLINHDGPDGWVPLASLDRVGGGYDGAPTIVFQGGFDLPPKKPGGGIIVDPVHHPKFPIVDTANLGELTLDPGNGGGGNGGGNVHPVHPIGPVVNPGGSSICTVKPQFCTPGGNKPKQLGGIGGFGLSH